MGRHRRTSTRRHLRGPVFLGSAAISVAVAMTALTAPARPAPEPEPAPAIVEAMLHALPAAEVPPAASEDPPPPPPDSGDGRRIVFAQGQQRVWLVEDDGSVSSTYLVSGSRFDNLQAGQYTVRARYRHVTGFDGASTMEYFVEFATGWSEPIGFHGIPLDLQGRPEQSVEELGTALSAGCVRQDLDDAVRLWEWAPIGTPVVVIA